MPNKIYVNPETAITWTDSGGDEVLDMGSLAADAGRVGSYHDMTAIRADLAVWQMIIDGFDTAPVVGETVGLYFAFSDGTNTDGPVGFNDTADSALASTNILPNLFSVRPAVVRSTTAADQLIVSGVVPILKRYIIPVVHNNTADALNGTGDAHKLILQPFPSEIQ